jgi:hypothetical protein
MSQFIPVIDSTNPQQANRAHIFHAQASMSFELFVTKKEIVLPQTPQTEEGKQKSIQGFLRTGDSLEEESGSIEENTSIACFSEKPKQNSIAEDGESPIAFPRPVQAGPKSLSGVKIELPTIAVAQYAPVQESLISQESIEPNVVGQSALQSFVGLDIGSNDNFQPKPLNHRANRQIMPITMFPHQDWDSIDSSSRISYSRVEKVRKMLFRLTEPPICRLKQNFVGSRKSDELQSSHRN